MRIQEFIPELTQWEAREVTAKAFESPELEKIILDRVAGEISPMSLGSKIELLLASIADEVKNPEAEGLDEKDSRFA